MTKKTPVAGKYAVLNTFGGIGRVMVSSTFCVTVVITTACVPVSFNYDLLRSD